MKTIQEVQNVKLSTRTIDLDCAPGTPRPDELFPQAIKGTSLTPDDFIITNKFFGNWEFTLIKSEEKEKEYSYNINIIASNVKDLYNNGSIRYGSW